MEFEHHDVGLVDRLHTAELVQVELALSIEVLLPKMNFVLVHLIIKHLPDLKDLLDFHFEINVPDVVLFLLEAQLHNWKDDLDV